MHTDTNYVFKTVGLDRLINNFLSNKRAIQEIKWNNASQALGALADPELAVYRMSFGWTPWEGVDSSKKDIDPGSHCWLHNPVDWATAIELWDWGTLKTGAPGDLEGHPLGDALGTNSCNLDHAHRCMSNWRTFSQCTFLKWFLSFDLPLGGFCSSSGENHPSCFNSESLRRGWRQKWPTFFLL